MPMGTAAITKLTISFAYFGFTSFNNRFSYKTKKINSKELTKLLKVLRRKSTSDAIMLLAVVVVPPDS